MAYNQCSGHRSFEDYATPDSPCYITAIELGYRNAIAAERMIASLLSVLGCTAIITLIISKRRLCNSKVQPIFVLSLADLALALMWISGAVVWFRVESPNREWCFAIFLITVILSAVTSNLNLVYALMVLSAQGGGGSSQVGGWSSCRTLITYIIAWMEPTVVFMVTFGTIAGITDFVHVADDCSCWCLPYFISVLPIAPVPYGNYTNSIESYTKSIVKLVTATAVLSASHYLVVFVLLVVIYVRVFTLHHRQQLEPLLDHPQVSKKSAFYFLAVFVISGGTNLIISLTYLHVLNEGYDITNLDWHTVLILTVQSLVGPLQGFLNGIVYGWTRGDFVTAVVSKAEGSDPLSSITKKSIKMVDYEYDGM